MKRRRPTPVGALARGLVAGAVGSAVQDLFFLATRSIAPAKPSHAFKPPERDQIEESATETVARRFVEGFMHRSISERGKERSATAVHYAFGAVFGGVYGLMGESWPALRSPAGALAYGLGVWMAGDDLLVPLFRLGGWPNAYPLKTHAYALSAHLVYGAALAASYEAIRPRSIAVAATALWAVRANARFVERLPAAARPAARKVIGAAVKARVAESRVAA